MTVTISIGSEQRSLRDADAEWIREQIHRQRAVGLNVCVRVQIHAPPLELNLTTPGCGGGVGGRQANRDELRVIELWNKLNLNKPDFSANEVIDFLKRAT